MKAKDDYSVIIFISLLHLITVSSVYYVTPDDQSDINNDCPIDHACHTLQYYLHNSSKYFTSNTQLHLLQGSHYINVDIVLDSLHNFSLVGSGVNSTAIECLTPSLIAIINCTDTVVKNFTTGSQCGGLIKPYFDIKGYMLTSTTRLWNPSNHKVRGKPIKTHTSVCVFNSYSTMILSLYIKFHGIFVINGLGSTTLSGIVLHDGNLEIFYLDHALKAVQVNSSHLLRVFNFKYCNNIAKETNNIMQIIIVQHLQQFYNTEVFIEESTFKFLKQIELISVVFLKCGSDKHLVAIKKCQFLNNRGVPQNTSGMITVVYQLCDNQEWWNITNINEVQIIDCDFIGNTAYHKPSIIIRLYLLFSTYYNAHFTLSNCSFAMNNNFSILKTSETFFDAIIKFLSLSDLKIIMKYTIQKLYQSHLFCTITISNSVFMQPGIGNDTNAIYCRDAILNFNGPIVFSNFNSATDSIITIDRVNLTVHGHIEFFNNTAVSLLSTIEFQSIRFKEGLLLNISNSKFYTDIFHTFRTAKIFDYSILQASYPMCFLQYVSDNGNLDHQFTNKQPINFSLIIHKTKTRSLSNMETAHCRWHYDSAFNITSPLLVNQRFISDYDNKWNNTLNEQNQRMLCSCTDRNDINCTVDIIGPIYPGQNAVFSLVEIDKKPVQLKNSSNAVSVFLETIFIIHHYCMNVTESIIIITFYVKTSRAINCTAVSYTSP